MSASRSHRWIVDSIGERTASVEIDGDGMAQVPRSLLPRDVREGDVLAVRFEEGGDAAQAMIHVGIDREATRAAFEASARQTRKGTRPDNDPGGPVSF